MNILFYGTHQKHYLLASWLRAKGHNCLLVLTEYLPRNMPEALDTSLKEGYPDWIIGPKYDRKSLLRRFLRLVSRSRFVPPVLQRLICYFELNPPADIKKRAQEFEVVFTSGFFGLLESRKLGRPIVFRSLGSDLCRLPFDSGNWHREFMANEFRKEIKRVEKVILYQEDMFWASRFLELTSTQKVTYSIPTDIDKLLSSIDESYVERIRSDYKPYTTVFFLPSRKNFDSNKSDYKGPDKVLEAFKKVKDELGNFCCIATMHGQGAEEFKSRTEDYGLSKYFHFIDPQPINILSCYYIQENFIVINDVGYRKSHLTGIAREVVSFGGLLIDSVETESKNFKSMYGNAVVPVWSEVEVDGIANALIKCAKMEEKDRVKIKNEVKLWARSHLHWESRIKELEDIIESANGVSLRNSR